MNDKVQEILNEVGKVIRGKDEAIELVMTAMLAKGHILVEDVPGVGKTTLAVAFSRAMELTERRLQFTPDVLPSDVVGFNMIGADGEFQYKPGAILCNLLLADEINRTSTKTQSALLEVMEEGQVTVDGVTRQLPNPFIVVATQNPVGSAGTQMLPESQLDRFMIRISMGYPTMEEEVRLIKERQDINPLDFIQEIISKRELLEMQDQVKQIYVDDKVLTENCGCNEKSFHDYARRESAWNACSYGYVKGACVRSGTYLRFAGGYQTCFQSGACPPPFVKR